MAEVGNIRIADEVVAKVAAKATIEIDGVYKMSGGVVEEVSELFGKKTLGKGVKVGSLIFPLLRSLHHSHIAAVRYLAHRFEPH